MSWISDTEHEEIERLANATIHELVFIVNHAENDCPDDANQCALTAADNIGRINELLVAAEKRMEEA